jgi:tRNA-2-methylthio-N6-dimethylallyladenosine synthase
MNKKQLFIQTFGCQMNVHDSDQIRVLLEESGFESTADYSTADLIVLNTCSIREKAAQKIYSQLGRYALLKQSRQDLVIAVGGCLAQQWGKELLRKAPYVDIVFGTHNIHRLPKLVDRVLDRRGQLVEIDFHKAIKSLGMKVKPVNGAISSFVTIMQGCNNFCSYCVVPHLRGPEESRPPQDIIDEVKMLADHGVKEVTLLGQNVNSYGKNPRGDTDFPGLLHMLGKITGISRIRFTTSHPKDFSDELMQCFRDIAQMCRHIHLPVQSGSDRILKRMNRKYTADHYIGKVSKLKEICPDISITSDMIVGFPGETDEDFQATIDLMNKIRFDNLFSFKYSEREGTAAKDFEEKVPEGIKGKRLTYLQSLQEQHTFEKNKDLEGTDQEILVDSVSKNSNGDLSGRTRSNKIVNFKGDLSLLGKTITIRIKRAYLHSLRGEQLT